MKDNRRKFSDNEKMLLFNEVDGRCPICGVGMVYKKNGKINKLFEVAHIYPANPRQEEKELLKDVERLSDDVNDLKNVVAVCRTCHKKFDTPRTVEEYNKWVCLKKKLIQETELKDTYSMFHIEIEIKRVLESLNVADIDENLAPLSYKPLKIDQKSNDTLPHVIKRSIKRDVVDYFNYIHQLFIDINEINPYKFDTLASQIKGVYCKCMQINSNQEIVYTTLVDWLNKETSNYSKRACEIVIAYFIQDCEVF